MVEKECAMCKIRKDRAKQITPLPSLEIIVSSIWIVFFLQIITVLGYPCAVKVEVE